jgi:alpha-ketoglutarate-dependent taurine dioxygenase
MDQSQTARTPAKQKRFPDTRRRAVDIASADLVKTSTLASGQALPLVVEPAVAGVDLADWAANNREFLDTRLLKHGAILFRGFGLDSIIAFERVCLALCPQLFSEYGDLPREGMSDKVYASTPYPPDKPILFHNESSHLPSWPRKQFFMCVQAAQQGGETPILDCREVYRSLDPDIRDRFAEKGLLSVRNFVPGIDVAWQEFFHTSDKAVVEESCRKEDMSCEWKPGDGLRIAQRSRAVLQHPLTREMVFFNQIQLHHPYCLGLEVRASLRSLFNEEDLPRNVYYGDGTAIEDEVMEKIGTLYWKLAVAFPWQEGDLIMIENMLVAHARNPFVGPRKIVVAMGEMIHGKDLN